MSRRIGNTLPLHVFIRRQQTLKLFRQLLKACRKVEPESLKRDISKEITSEFKKHKFIVDTLALRSLVQTAQSSLVKLEDMCNIKSTPYKDNSWLNTSDETDQKGRVGKGWPWK